MFFGSGLVRKKSFPYTFSGYAYNIGVNSRKKSQAESYKADSILDNRNRESVSSAAGVGESGSESNRELTEIHEKLDLLLAEVQKLRELNTEKVESGPIISLGGRRGKIFQQKPKDRSWLGQERSRKSD